MEFEDEPPPQSERPFLIAGLVAVFLLEGEPFPLGIRDIGRPGCGQPPSIPAEAADDLRPSHISRIETIRHLFIILPDVDFIIVYPGQVLV